MRFIGIIKLIGIAQVQKINSTGNDIGETYGDIRLLQ